MEMGKTGTKISGFCLNRIRPHARVRSPPTKTHKHDAQSITPDVKNENSPSFDVKTSEYEAKSGLVNGRKVMIVVDSSIEAKGAVQWALSQSVQKQDRVILLHVVKASEKGSCHQEHKKEISPRAYQLVYSFKNMCQMKRPEVEIEVAVVEGKEKGPKIVEEARKQGVALLVMGQRKRSTTWRLLVMWAAGNRASAGMVEYCIQNADCMAIAVRRKSKIGGYMITTKRHKDFWLLA